LRATMVGRYGRRLTPCECDASEAGLRARAAAYADTYAMSRNQCYRWFPGADCTNFVSQSLYGGGLAMWDLMSPAPWYHYDDGTFATSWTVTYDLFDHLLRSGRGAMVAYVPLLDVVPDSTLSVGDIILYDLPEAGNLNHAMLVVEKNGLHVAPPAPHEQLQPPRSSRGDLVDAHEIPREHVH